jgi:hypothetical protein
MTRPLKGTHVGNFIVWGSLVLGQVRTYTVPQPVFVVDLMSERCL